MSARRLSFRVADQPPRTPGRHPVVPLMMCGGVILSWAGAVGIVWAAYVVCRLTGLAR